MRVLVTGGAGFIGSHLSEALVGQGHEVRVLDNLKSGRLGNLRSIRKEIEFVKGDCADTATARRATKRIETVYHEAAIPSVTRSVDDPVGSHRANATATLIMLEAARDAGVRRFVYAGSSSVYGESRELPKAEGMPPAPLSPYAVGKLMGEHYLRVFAQLYGMETLTLRYFNVFGPRQDAGSPYSGVISLFATALLTGRTPVIYGDGRQSRDFTYVANVVEGNLLALEAPGLKGQVLNLATGRRVTLLQLLRTLARVVGRAGKVRHLPPRAGDIRHSHADVRLASELLGFRPSVKLEAGLRRTVDWYGERLRRGRTKSVHGT